eukprot:1252855-Prymnesium_polylepis.1
MCACCDRVSNGTLGGDHVGDMQPSGAQLGGRMSAQESSGAVCRAHMIKSKLLDVRMCAKS